MDDDELRRVESWRESYFHERTGCPLELARALAIQPVDTHEFEHLVERGCPPRLAARILEPLDATVYPRLDSLTKRNASGGP